MPTHSKKSRPSSLDKDADETWCTPLPKLEYLHNWMHLLAIARHSGVTIGTPMLHSDSMSAIQQAQNLIFHAKTKHIKVKYHFIIKEVLKDKWLELVKVHIDDNPTYLLTKGLPYERFACLKELMGIGL